MPQSVVLVHGLRNDARMWRVQVKALRGAGHEAIAVDLPGHGTRVGERFTLQGAVDTISAAAAEASHPVFVCGYSLGGYVAMQWAGETPRDITGLLLSSCATQPYRLLLGGWRTGARAVHSFRALPLQLMDDALRAMRNVHPLASLRRVDKPVWLVNGSLDHFRIEERRYLAAAQNARLIHVPGATHMVSIVKPAEFTRILLDAVDSVAP